MASETAVDKVESADTTGTTARMVYVVLSPTGCVVAETEEQWWVEAIADA